MLFQGSSGRRPNTMVASGFGGPTTPTWPAIGPGELCRKPCTSVLTHETIADSVEGYVEIAAALVAIDGRSRDIATGTAFAV